MRRLGGAQPNAAYWSRISLLCCRETHQQWSSHDQRSDECSTAFASPSRTSSRRTSCLAKGCPMYREHQEVGSPADVVNKKGCLGDFRERLYPPYYAPGVLPNRPDWTDIGDLSCLSLGYSFQEIALSGHHVLLLSLSGMKHTQLQKVEVGY